MNKLYTIQQFGFGTIKKKSNMLNKAAFIWSITVFYINMF